MRTLLLGALFCLPLAAQVLDFSPEEMVKATSQNPYGRFDDGRPKVPDELLHQARDLSLEDCWGVFRKHGFANQYEIGWKTLYPGRKLAGRAFTVMFMPQRPDLTDLITAGIKARGFPRGGHQFALDMLQPGDVIVVDGFGKVPGFVGDNLATWLEVATKDGGMVIDGGIRDLQGMQGVDTQIYYRFAHPAPVGIGTLVGLNVPVRIGDMTVLPGDVIVGDEEGITAIPPHLLQEVLDTTVEIRIHDEWTKEKLRTGKYKSHEIYGSPLDPELIKEYESYKKNRLEELDK